MFAEVAAASGDSGVTVDASALARTHPVVLDALRTRLPEAYGSVRIVTDAAAVR